MHGSASTGAKSGPTALKDPLRSSRLPKGLAERYETSLADGELLSTRRNAALVETFLGDTLENMEGAPSMVSWKSAIELYAVLKAPMEDALSKAEKDALREEKKLAFDQLGEVLAAGLNRLDAENRALGLMDSHARHAETEHRRLAQIDANLNASQLTAILAAIIGTIHKHIVDVAIRQAVAADLAGILRGGSSGGDRGGPVGGALLPARSVPAAE